MGESIRGCIDACTAEHTRARLWVCTVAGHRAARRACDSTAHTIQHPIEAVLALRAVVVAELETLLLLLRGYCANFWLGRLTLCLTIDWQGGRIVLLALKLHLALVW